MNHEALDTRNDAMLSDNPPSEATAPRYKSIEKNSFTFHVTVTRNAAFWDRMATGEWEPETFRVLDRFITADTYYLDVGAWIGPTALYAAQMAERAYAFEPDPIAYDELKSNVEANRHAKWADRLRIYNQAVAATNGKIKFGSLQGGGDSMSSVLFAGVGATWEVESVAFEDFLRRENLENKKLFVKMDIEGGEFALIPELLPVLRKYDITLYLSTHPPFVIPRTPLYRIEILRFTLIGKIAVAWRHFKLVRSLPFKYRYDSNGKRISLWRIWKTASSDFPFFEVVATNHAW
jgi:FkbM family methyltransferase